MNDFPELKEDRLITFDLNDGAIEEIGAVLLLAVDDPNRRIDQTDENDDEPDETMDNR